MINKDCRLARAAMCFGGGGGGASVNQEPGGFRNWGKESKDIKKGYGFQFGQYNNYVEQNPLLKTSQQGALNFYDQMFGPQGSQQQWSSAFAPGGAVNQGIGNELGIIQGRGYSPELARDASQLSRQQAAQTGTTQDPSALINEYQQRESTRQGQLAGAQSRLSGYQGLESGAQGMQTGALNQMLGVGNAAVSQFGGLTNPILSYMQGIFGGNQQAAIAQAQIQAQQDAASSGKKGSTGGAAIGAVGSVLGAVL